ncbi:MAG: TonB-dependent receptor [Bacteroidetes bacterium]|nr:TonB-dependent receptor [Bacteroidota bacterium]
MKQVFLVLSLLLSGQMIFAQYNISGMITDVETGETLIGATIFIPEISKGTVTDEKGEYHLDHLPSGLLTLEFAYLGFSTVIKKVYLKDQDEILNVSLVPTIIHTQEVVISSSSYTTQHENAVKIETIGMDEITSTGSPNVIESISNIPGVDMISKGNGVAKPVIRGLSNSNVVVLNNGVKLENYQFSEDHPFSINEFGLDKVEVIKGPASLLYGSDAVGGIINVIPEKPAPSRKIIGDLNTQYFSNTEGISANLGVRGSGTHFNWSLRGGMKNHKDYQDGNGNTVFNSRFNEEVIKLNAGYNEHFGSFQLYYDYNRMKLGMVTPDALVLVNTNERQNEFWYQDLTNHLLTARNKIFFGRYKIGVDMAWQNNTRILNTDEKNEVNMNMNVLSYDVKTWLPSGENTEYIIGTQGAFKENQNQGGHIRVLPDFNQSDYSLMGWLKHTHQNRISVQAGVRWEYRILHIPEQEKASHSHEEPGHEDEPEIMAALERNYQNMTFSLGGTWEINPEFLIRINGASAYRNPNVAELTQDGVHGSRYEQGNRDLNSQRSYEADLSGHYHSKIMELDLAGFYNHINDYIYLAPTDEYDDDLRIYRYTQNNARLYGLEASYGIYPMHWLNLNATYTFLRGERTDGSNLPFIPQDKIKFDVKLEKDEIGFIHSSWFSTGITHAFDQDRPAQFETETANYLLLRAGIGFKIKVQKQFLDFSIVATNILNEVYYDHLSTLKDMNIYNMGRNLTFNVRIPFGVKD